MALYRSRLVADLPAGVPVEAAAAARDTLGSAVASAAELPAELGAALVQLAREAFVQGMQISSAISAVVAACIAILAVAMLRHVTTHEEGEAGAESAESPSDRAVEPAQNAPAPLEPSAAPGMK